MKKLIDWWFDAEQIAMKIYKSEYFDIVIKIFKTIVLLIICVMTFGFVLILNITKALVNNVPKQSEKYKNTPAIGTPMGAVTANTKHKDEQPELRSVASEKYNKFGMPEEMGKKGKNMSENDYYNLRKVL